MRPMDFAATGAFPAHLRAVPGVRMVPVHPTGSAGIGLGTHPQPGSVHSEDEMMLVEADRQAVEALAAVEPAWTGMRTAADALGIRGPYAAALWTAGIAVSRARPADTELRRGRVRLRGVGRRSRRSPCARSVRFDQVRTRPGPSPGDPDGRGRVTFDAAHRDRRSRWRVPQHVCADQRRRPWRQPGASVRAPGSGMRRVPEVPQRRGCGDARRRVHRTAPLVADRRPGAGGRRRHPSASRRSPRLSRRRSPISPRCATR